MKMTESDRSLRGAEAFTKNAKYRPFMEALKDSPLAKVRPITNSDYVCLGKQFKQFENYRRMVNEIGTLKDLGQLPKYAYDVITANYAASVIPLLASVQPIKAQQGIVYFKQIQAKNSRGNVTSGNLLRNAIATPETQAIGFAGENVIEDKGALAALQGAATSYTFTLAKKPLRQRTFRLVLSSFAGKQAIIDDGEGNLASISGNLGYGTVDYEAGTATVTFVGDVSTKTCSIQYGTDFEEGGNDNMATIQAGYDTADVKAEVFTIRSEMGLLKAYEMKQTFGKEAETEMINDLTQEINAELGNTLIARLAGAKFGADIAWSATAGTGVSEVEHKLAFRNRIAEASAQIATAAGRGEVTAIVTGVKGAALFDQLGGLFERTGYSSSGPTLYGMYNKNIPVIRSVDTAHIDASSVYTIFKGSGNFDAPAVYSPYMPLVVNGSLPVLNNVLKTQGYALCWSAMKVVVNRFIAKIQVSGLN